ncbi:MAG TPA: hypothetical protein VFN74_21125, partial [Chloroflexota bacterium]|nr:hypothetical protein [Chloroflexota bacterium]
ALPRRSRRQQLVSAIEVAAEAARRAEVFTGLGEWCAGLVVGPRERWVEAREGVGVYPAFG